MQTGGTALHEKPQQERQKAPIRETHAAMTYATLKDRDAIEQEMPWENRDVPATTWGLLCDTAGKYGDRDATTFQMFSGPSDPCETLTWAQLRDRTAQAANDPIAA